MSQGTRAFIGLDLSLGVCEKLCLVQEDLKSLIRERGAQVRWVRPENLHLTLKFMGELDGAQLQQAREALKALSLSHRPFHLSLRGVGAFPDGSRPRVLYAAVKKGAAPLLALVEEIESRLEEVGVPRESRAYLPHITLGRVKTRSAKIDLGDVVDALDELPLGETEVLETVLFESFLHRQGARYRVLSRAYLKGVGAGSSGK